MPTPKVMEAVILWSRAPSELAADLSRYHQRRIADWHSGELSSFEMLELLEHLPEDGAYKTALRDGAWTDQEAAIFQIANELAILRSAHVPGVDSADLGSQLFRSPAEIRRLIAEAKERQEGTIAVLSHAIRTQEN